MCIANIRHIQIIAVTLTYEHVVPSDDTYDESDLSHVGDHETKILERR